MMTDITKTNNHSAQQFRKRAFITGITGQDGSYLAEFLLEKGYEIHGLIRRSSTDNLSRISHLLHDPPLASDRLNLHYGEMTDGDCLTQLISMIQPDEVYNLAAQSHVHVSFQNPSASVNVTALGALHILEACRHLQDSSGDPVRVYQAGSSEMFGGHASTVPQDERTSFHPRSPYACAKVYAHHQVVNYREAYGMFACNGILFNHESPRRGEQFVTRKISLGVARIVAGLQQKLHLGNLDAERDWGFAKEYVSAMWLMLQQSQPDDYVIATGETHSVHEFVSNAFRLCGLDWQDYVVCDEHLIRPSEVNCLKGNAEKARNILGWVPQTSFDELIKFMVEHDRKQIDSQIFINSELLG